MWSVEGDDDPGTSSKVWCVDSEAATGATVVKCLCKRTLPC